MREEPKKQKDKEIADCQPWYNMQRTKSPPDTNFLCQVHSEVQSAQNNDAQSRHKVKLDAAPINLEHPPKPKIIANSMRNGLGD
ncbi:hypothetical protein AVEN_202881-1 [Araneus ventricosus]|uniref:Uncharacterized protein n=1 Tax=Araneus ventricosus TaxID=182803 RepID=A0A4Y2FJS4_ARAVE|nr:hypothetical protein AVEN_202881-1 [Araneus ventricosus]